MITYSEPWKEEERKLSRFFIDKELTDNNSLRYHIFTQSKGTVRMPKNKVHYLYVFTKIEEQTARFYLGSVSTSLIELGKQIPILKQLREKVNRIAPKAVLIECDMYGYPLEETDYCYHCHNIHRKHKPC